MAQTTADEGHAYPHAKLTGAIIGCFYRVYNALGPGFLENVYQRALLVEFAAEGIGAADGVPVEVFYRGHGVGEYRADLIVEDAVLLELKAARQIEPGMEAQLLNYLGATRIDLRLLLNFGPEPQVRRFVYDRARRGPSPTQ